jgi:RHS repeat-associated protein
MITVTWRHRIEGPGGLLAIVNCSGASGYPTVTTSYVHRDHLGSPELITNSAGTEVVKLSFGAFGERRDRDWHGAVSSSDMTTLGNTTRRGFTEHEHLDSVGLIHMNGRVYDPVLARFLSSDPVEDGLGRPGGFNRYAYVSNRPLTLVDPSGYGSSATRLPKHDAGPLGPLFEPQNWSVGSGDDTERGNANFPDIEVIASRLSNWPMFVRFYGFGSTGATGGSGEWFPQARGGPAERGPDPAPNGGDNVNADVNLTHFPFWSPK